MITKKAKLSKVLKNIYFQRNEPVSVVHFLTNRCNARCSFCFIDFDDPKTFAGELSLAEIEKLTKNLGNSLLNVNFTGGEPFARKDIGEIANLYIKNTTIQSIYITTNASLPDRILRFSKEIIKKNQDIELTVQISIDSFPERHNEIRKVKNLFNTCYETFHALKKISNRISPVVAITVTNENCDDIKEIYRLFVEKYKFNAIKCIAVRDEGIYKTPTEEKQKIFDAYTWLSKKIEEDSKSKILENYNYESLQGRLHAKKDIIANKMVQEMYMKPKYISPCHAGSLLGVISASGSVFPCEILEDKKIGELRDFDMNFMKMWKTEKARQTKKFILESKCHCTYECALSYNILANWRYQPELIYSAIKK
jgi:MoaA/NifB/PqqE/SkfB family radical SAM enzyme